MKGGQFMITATVFPSNNTGAAYKCSAQLNQNFKFGILHWDNEVAYQKTSNQGHPPLPDLSAYSNLYIVFHIARYCACSWAATSVISRNTMLRTMPHHPTVYGAVAGNADEVRQLSHLQRLRQSLPEALPLLCEREPCKQRNRNKNAFLVPPLSHQSMNIHFGLS